MYCWNCGKPMLDTARRCGACEAPADLAPTAEEEEIVAELLTEMPPEALEELRSLFSKSKTAEDFANRIIVGPCPRCHSEETGDCQHDPEIDTILVGRCFQCGQLWCTDCLRPLDPVQPSCPCWEEEVDEELGLSD